ncbi:MAG: response regulator [Desulfuromonadaceae bacterium]|nr:response regulator [Desulfuromonadaceae bacterium]
MAVSPPQKILIVDDDADMATALKLYLEEEGYDTSVANDGKTALEMMLGGNRFSQVLLDISMPNLDGITVLKLLRDSNCDASVIMMSGHGSEDLAVECMKNGAEDYISKPFAMADLLQRIKRARNHRLTLIEKMRLEQEKEDFYLMLSHDLKNPMTAVIGSIDIIREGRLGPVNEEQIEYLQSAIDSCNEVITMINNLLDIRRFEAGKMPLAIRHCNLEEIIRKVVAQFSQTAEHDGIRLSLNLDSSLPDIAIDQKAMVRIMGNLLGNSLKFTPLGGEIVVTCDYFENSLDTQRLRIPIYASIPKHFSEITRFVRIRVRDSGIGIPSQELKRIFDRYEQYRSGSGREQGGAGLGLAFCKWAVESFDGVIWAESENGKGSEIIILLPCSE